MCPSVDIIRLCRRFSAHQIDEMLGISTRTVERYMEHIYEKLVVNKKEAC